jgi:PadR family transcriptional regulator, regulatory protein PadR
MFIKVCIGKKIYIGHPISKIMDCACGMKGYLSFLIMWLLKSKKMNGSQIATEIGKRKGSRPSPGTIYPALKELKSQGYIKADKQKAYCLTKKGKRELSAGCKFFCDMFHDFNKIFKVSKCRCV